MATKYAELQGRFAVGLSNRDINVVSNGGDNNALILTSNAGTYIGDYFKEINARVNEMANITANVWYNSSTGLGSITCNAGINVYFTDSAIQDLFGVSADLTDTATAYNAGRTPRYTWRPSRGLSDHSVDIGQFYSPRSASKVVRSIDGTTYSVVSPAVLYDAEVEFMHLNAAETVTPSNGTSYQDFQQFWVDIIHAGQPIRFIQNRDDSSTYKTVIVGSDDMEAIGSFDDFAGRHIDKYQGLWDVRIPFMKHVTN